MAIKIQEKLETLSLLVTSLCGLGISLLDFLGLLDSIPFLKERTPSISLLVLSIVALNIPFKGREQSDKIERKLTETQLRIENIEQRLLSQPAQGIEIFSTTDEILDRLVEVTVGADSVSTLNLSSARGTSPALDKYFAATHQYIKRQDSPLKSFRSLATLETISKARWILERAVELGPTGKVSQSVFPIESSTKIPVGFHIVFKNQQTPFVFFYPPVNPEGMMNGFLIKNKEVAETMLKYFDLMWRTSTSVHGGKIVKREGLAEILRVDKNLEKDKNYITLNRIAESYK